MDKFYNENIKIFDVKHNYLKNLNSKNKVYTITNQFCNNCSKSF